jgi:hypothetical protein
MMDPTYSNKDCLFMEALILGVVVAKGRERLAVSKRATQTKI